MWNFSKSQNQSFHTIYLITFFQVQKQKRFMHLYLLMYFQLRGWSSFFLLLTILYKIIFQLSFSKMNSVELSTTQKQAFVGSLLTHAVDDNSSSFKFATWYRVTSNEKKIVKMKIIRNKETLTYRCSVFDAGSIIELHLENDQDTQQSIKFGPVKFHPYFLKQLEECKHNLTHFAIAIHIKTIQTIPARIHVNIKEEDILVLNLQIKKQQTFNIQLPQKEDWRDYQQVFCLQQSKLTDIYLKQFVKTPDLLQKLLAYKLDLSINNNLHFTFTNVIQKNLFLAQIFKKIKNQNRLINRLSQVKSIALSQSKSCLQNQMNDLFKSQNPMVNSQLSQKIFKDFQDVIFTPQSHLQGDQSKQKYFYIFDQFLNPEQNKQQMTPKLSDIAEDDDEQMHERTATATNLAIKATSNTQKMKKSIYSSESSIRQIHKLKVINRQKQYLEQIKREKQKLKRQNKILKKENSYLKNRLRKTAQAQNNNNKITFYQMPQFIKNKSKQKRQCFNNTVSAKQIFCDQETLSRDRSFNFPVQKQDQEFGVKKQKRIYIKKKHSNTTERMQYEEEMKKKYQLISMSAKTIKRFPQNGSNS